MALDALHLEAMIATSGLSHRDGDSLTPGWYMREPAVEAASVRCRFRVVSDTSLRGGLPRKQEIRGTSSAGQFLQ